MDGYPGIYYRIAKRIGKSGNEKVYYVRYKVNGKTVEHKAGRQYKDDMTPAKASLKRSRFIEGLELPPVAKRKAIKAKKRAEQNKYTIKKLWDEYKKSRKPGKSFDTDKGRYENYLKSPFGNKEPKNIIALDVERLKRRLLKTKSPQTVKHVLNLLTWIINYGTKNGLCPSLTFQIKKPAVDNIKTEDLTQEQLKRLLEAIDNYPNTLISNLMKMALYTGMRRGELFKLKWDQINFERGFISIIDPKGGIDHKIPMNNEVIKLLEKHPRPKYKVKGTKNKYTNSPFVFPGRGGRQRVSCQVQVNEIKANAGLPDDFRPMHGLRHVYASMLASSGQVDMYTLQKLLTHKSPLMTQRYAHLRDETLKNASNIAGEHIVKISNRKE